jgi:probable phosphoglycerate mutase
MSHRFQRPFVLPAGATEVLLVRHGATSGITVDAELTAFGALQGRVVGERLADDCPCAALFVSGMRRTAATATVFAERTGLSPIVVPQLNEVHLGGWDGAEFDRRVSTADPVMVRAMQAHRWDLLPGGESMTALAARVAAGLDLVVDGSGPDARAVAFVHGGVIAEACRQATGSRAFAFLFSENGSITRLVRLADGEWRLHGFNDVTHLAGLSPTDVPLSTDGAAPPDGDPLLSNQRSPL